MKKFLTGAILFSGVLGFAAGASALETPNDPSTGSKTVIDQSDTTVEVEGTLGMDNTDPESPIDEGDTKWVNVTVPMKTIFYSVGSSTSVSSPTYTITNNSGRPVTVTANSFATQSAGALTGVTSLNVTLDVTGTAINVPVISNGGANIATPTDLGELANSEGKLNEADAEDSESQELTFGYSGSFTAGDVTSTITETYDLGLKFAPTAW